MEIGQTWLERSNEIELPGWVCKAIWGFIWDGIGSLQMSSFQSLEVALNSVSSSLTIFFPGFFGRWKSRIYNLIFVTLWAQKREVQVQDFSVIFFYIFKTRGLRLASMTVHEQTFAPSRLMFWLTNRPHLNLLEVSQAIPLCWLII